jgi:hypothetical protein
MENAKNAVHCSIVLFSVFVLAGHQFLHGKKLEQWRSGAVGGATMWSNVPLFNFSGLQEPAFAGFIVGAYQYWSRRRVSLRYADQ